MDRANVALALGGRSLWIAVFGVSLLRVRRVKCPNSSVGEKGARRARQLIDGDRPNSKVLKKVPPWLS